MLRPAWPCEPSFGVLCPRNGLNTLSATDRELATRSGLRVYVYKTVPPSFHSQLFENGMPPEVRKKQMCDFASAPCTPRDPPISQPGYTVALNEWLHSMKHCADVPLLAKLLALGMLPGVHTDNPSEAHLFVVPFLGGFIERVSPAMSNRLSGEQRHGRGVVDRLFDHLLHFSNATAARHLFLLTNSCGGCLRQPCWRCATWQAVHSARSAGVELAATLGPSWPTYAIPRGRAPPSGRKWLHQVIVPPNVMEAELHAPKYVPLCMRSESANVARGRRANCRPNTANRELFAFYQGAHSFNGARDLILSELSRSVFGSNGRDKACNCATTPLCCVNASSRVAFFYTKSHWHPVTPLGFSATIEWMQRSRFCICPPGDVPYNKRYFTALLAGCVPVLFSFQSQVRGERNWWKPRKGPGQRDIDPFYEQINHSELAVEVTINTDADYKGFVDRLRAVPTALVEAKQRAIERVRGLLLYDVSGSSEDAFTCLLRQLMPVLAGLPEERGAARPPLRFGRNWR